MKWEVYRCDFVDEYGPEPDRACGIRELNDEKQHDGSLGRMIVSDTNREECCHALKMSDAQQIVDCHNLLEESVIRLKGDIPPEQFRDFMRQWNGMQVASRAIVRDAEPLVNGVEVLTGFCSWIICLGVVRSEMLQRFGNLMKVFADENQLGACRPGWHERLKFPVDPEMLAFVEKTMAETAAVTAPVPHETLDAIALGRPTSEEIERQEKIREKRKRDLAEHNEEETKEKSDGTD